MYILVVKLEPFCGRVGYEVVKTKGLMVLSEVCVCGVRVVLLVCVWGGNPREEGTFACGNIITQLDVIKWLLIVGRAPPWSDFFIFFCGVGCQ